jgi:ABC-type glycerol-3-phosphate transport system permease component
VVRNVAHRKAPSRLITQGLLYVLMIVAALVFIAPLLWMVSTAFKPAGQVLSYPPRWIPLTPTLANFSYILHGYAFGRWWINSILAALASTVLVLFVDSLAAYALARMRFIGSGLIYALILSMLLVPIQVAIIPLYLLFSSAAMLDTLPAVFLPTVANVTGIFILRQFFRTIPNDLEDAAKIDGANRLQFWYMILLPLSRPPSSLLSVAGTTFSGRWWRRILTARAPCRLAWRSSSAEPVG